MSVAEAGPVEGGGPGAALSRSLALVISENMALEISILKLESSVGNKFVFI